MGLFNKFEEFAFGAPKKQESNEMYPQELEQLISIAIEDGVITEKERQVLHKKAAKFDIDPDELDMVLEARLRQKSANSPAAANTPSQPKTPKSNGPKKCPTCGEVLTDSNTVHCPYCGYKVLNIVKDILEQINSVAPPKKEQQNSGFFGKIADLIESDNVRHDLIRQKKEIILSYNVPNVKEVVLEFLAFSVQKGCKDREIDYWTDIFGESWYKKSEQVIADARRAYSQDLEFMAILKEYAIKFGMEKKGLFRR